jgi:hypothetical protein
VAPLLLLLLAAQQPLPGGYRPLFDGVSLSGWRGRPHLDPRTEAAWTPEERAAAQAEWDDGVRAHWRVEAGEIVNDGEGPFLTTVQEFGDAEFLLEYRTVPLADSGIYLRATPQVQIWDWTEAGGKWELGADKGSGGLWNNEKHPRFPTRRLDAPFGEWNRVRIRIVGERVWVWLNGGLVVPAVPMENYWDRAQPLFARGPLQLQTHGGEIRFRGLGVRELGPEEAAAYLHSVPPELPFRRGEADAALGRIPPATQVFDGVTWNGWRGALDGWEIADGAMRCKEGAGGTICTVAEYGDFVASFEFRLPPGGNNGLAIRYPGEGDTAYVGMCELQVLDDTAEQYAALQPWQYHGSAYGMAPARRGMQRAVGEWNYQQVTVAGGRVMVELNGVVILDADLHALHATADGKEHPGRMRARGSFGFAGHGDPVEFRNVHVRGL